MPPALTKHCYGLDPKNCSYYNGFVEMYYGSEA